MRRVLSNELRSHVGSRVKLAGWLHHQRRLSRVTFLLLRDRTGIAQVVLDEPADLGSETVLEVEGGGVANEQAPGGVEIHEPTLRVLAEPLGPPPLELRRPRLKEQLPTLLDHAVLAWRHPLERAKLQIAAASVAGFRDALSRLGFTEIQTPKIVASRTESGANVFALDYFGRRAYLAQSPQFYKQMMVGALERVFEVGPAFRAEPHETGRHLAEYVSLDAEVGFIGGPADVMAVAREAVAGMVAGVRRLAGPALGLLDVELPDVPAQIPLVHF